MNRERIETSHEERYETGEHIFHTRFGREVMLTELPHAIFQETVRQVAEIIAKQVLEDKLTEILEKVTPQAIANMAIAEAGAALNETLHKKMPDKIIEIEKRSTELRHLRLFSS